MLMHTSVACSSNVLDFINLSMRKKYEKVTEKNICKKWESMKHEMPEKNTETIKTMRKQLWENVETCSNQNHG